MIRNKYIAFTLFIIAFDVVWLLLEKIFTGSFSMEDTGLPTLIAATLGYFYFLKKK
ncbi:MAG: hypothetical protein IJI46_10310 [Erysipelotrichaceae bacterium]|nr:hypothetical protein [Erysipelotrichaceae bacterium]